MWKSRYEFILFYPDSRNIGSAPELSIVPNSDSFLRKRSLLPRQCIICFLILLVIGASIATAFLIGHWLELDQQGNDQSLKVSLSLEWVRQHVWLQLIKQLTPSKSPDPPPLTTTTSLSPSAQLTTPAVPILREVLTERIIPVRDLVI